MAETVYLYSVNPRRTISGLSGVKAIRSPKSLYLTLEDVEICLPKAVVHRRFANEGRFEKVTLENYKRLHNDKFMTEAEYKEFLKKEASKDSGTVKEVNTETAPDKIEEKTVEETVSTTKEENGVNDSVETNEVATKEDEIVDVPESERLYESDDEDPEEVATEEEE